jgi:predicted ABC-type ATPase
MDYSKQTLLVISGPNGAGKSTAIQALLPTAFEGILSFDRDKTRSLFEKQLTLEETAPDEMVVKATRMMEARLEQEMDQAIKSGKHFVLETPLSHPDYWKYIDRFERNGYQVQLNYLCLNRIKDCKTRVEHRVMEGGHYVDARTIKGVYEMNLKYINDFKDTFKVIELLDGTNTPTVLVKIEDHKIIFANNNALQKQWIKSGLPSIAEKITIFLVAQKGTQKKAEKLKKRKGI